MGAQNADQAIAILKSPEGAKIDLVLTDLTMPGRSGISLIVKAQELLPRLPIIVITGLAANDETAWVRDRGLPILKKPFEPNSLDEIIRKHLCASTQITFPSLPKTKHTISARSTLSRLIHSYLPMGSPILVHRQKDWATSTTPLRFGSSEVTAWMDHVTGFARGMFWPRTCTSMHLAHRPGQRES